MNKIMILFVAFIVPVVLFTGCSKNENEPGPVNQTPGPVFTPPTISITPDQNVELLKGDSITFKWNMTGDLKNPIVTIDGDTISTGKVGEHARKMSTVGVYTFSASCQALLDGARVQKSSTITVKDPIIPPPPPTKEDSLLCLGPWNMIKLEFQANPDDPWIELQIWECMQDDLITFYLTPTKISTYDNGQIHCYEGEFQTSEGPWSMTGSLLNVGFNCNIITLNKDSLVWINPEGDSEVKKDRRTFIHPGSHKK